MGLLPLPDTIPQKTLGGWRFLLDGQELFRLAEPLESGPGPGCTLISQPALLRHLLALLGKLPHVSLVLGRRVERLVWRGDRVCGVQLADGATISANLVVATDGRDSPLRQQARIQLLERDRPFDLLWFRLDGGSPSPLEGLFTTLVGREGLFSAFEGASGSVQIGWVQSPSRRSPGNGPGQAGLNAHLAERLAAQSPPDLARWRISLALSMLPVASLIATTLGWRASRSTVSGAIATPQRPTSPTDSGSSESRPMSVGRSNAVERPVLAFVPLAFSSRYLKRRFVSSALPKPANWRIVQRRERYIVLCTPRVKGNWPGSPMRGCGFDES
jgi:hypothetical protein